MFCPNCGRDDSHKRKFCPSCGTNLEIISDALSDEAEGPFTKLDRSLDKFIARYAEHVFKDAPLRALERKVGRSWQILGQGILTSLFDMALFSIMFMLLPLRFVLLLFRTPIRLITERNQNRKRPAPMIERGEGRFLPDGDSNEWLINRGVSVTEHTTVSLAENKGEQGKRRKL
jgi:hypothetical protein